MRKALFFFGILDDSDVEWMISTGRRVEIEPRTVLIQEGVPMEDMYLVIDGALSVRAAALDGKEIARAMSGEVLGEISFVDARPPSASVIAVERTLLLAVPRDRLSQKLEDDAPFAARFYRALAVFLADRLRSTVSQLGFGRGQPTQKEIEERDELDVDVLEDISLASTRFDRLQRRVRSLSPVGS
jgi:CRP/FNR family transcriptional regulator, cyclic AMP receptor protein